MYAFVNVDNCERPLSSVEHVLPEKNKTNMERYQVRDNVVLRTLHKMFSEVEIIYTRILKQTNKHRPNGMWFRGSCFQSVTEYHSWIRQHIFER